MQRNDPPYKMTHCRLESFLCITPAQQIFFPRIGDSNCDRIYSSLTAVHFYDDIYGKAASGLGRIFCGVLVKKSMDRCTGCHDMNEILLKTLFTPYNQSINQSINHPFSTVDHARSFCGQSRSDCTERAVWSQSGLSKFF